VIVRIPPVLLALVSAGVFALGVAAQEKLSVQGPNPATVRLGDVSTVVLRIDGRTANPRAPKLPVVPGLTLDLSAPSTSSRSFFDGRTLTEQQTVSYQLTLRPQREGSFVVPPFSIWTGTSEQSTEELRIDVRRDLKGEELGWITVSVEPLRAYVHEPLRVHVEFGVQQGLRLVQDVYDRYRYLDVEVQAPWLKEFPGGEPIELPTPEGDVRLIVGNRQLFQAYYKDGVERGGQKWQRFSFDRAFLPTQIGKIELPAPILRYHVLTREGQQDLFGRPRGQVSDNFYAFGKPITIDVLPIPEAGRPTPYFGAVGRFQIHAALDKDTVKVGNSVKLTLTVTGQGNFEFLRMPTIDELPGFHKLGQAEAKRDADKVVVTYDFTPLSADVHEVPAIGWNYFDTTPGVEKFVEVKTSALPLAVQPLANGETLAPLADTAVKSVTPGVDDIFDLPDFTGPAAERRPVAAWAGWLAALGPWLVACLGLVAFRTLRRRAGDLDGQRARAALRTCRKALAAGGDPLDVLAGYLGDRRGVAAAAVIRPDLAERLVEAQLDEALAAEVARAIEQGTAARYGGGQSIDGQQVEQLVQRLEGARFGVRVILPFVLWPLLAMGALCPDLRAQAVPDAVAATTAYRAGDYRTALQGFTKAFEVTGDRRYWQARGNCHYRLGELPEALWAYESARLGIPRDPDLLADLRLVRQQLQLEPRGEGFLAELSTLRDRLTPNERLLLCALCMTGAAGCFVLGWRRVGLRWIGVLFLAPGCALAAEVLWLGPARPPLAIALKDLPIVSEPREGLPAIATVRAGKELDLLGGDQGTFVRVQVGERSGYAARERLAIVR
jgi:tetratricopeptide (TPR) repeat protein